MGSGAVAVSAKTGVITLRGTVGSFTETSQAKWDALGVQGVVGVDDALEVEVLDESRRDDAELRGAVLQALTLNSLVPPPSTPGSTTVGSRSPGMATWRYQRAEAERVTSRIQGVAGISNDIELVLSGPSAGDVAEAITRAMQRRARLDASNISVQSSNGTVTLSGTVRSWADHDEAISAAWNAPGVTRVVDDLQVRN